MNRADHPIVTICMANGKKIVLELFPESAPNTVNSFLYVAEKGIMDRHKIQRIVPGNWIDFTYTAYHNEEAKYLIPNEFELHPQIQPLESHPGCVCVGGYGEDGLSSSEIFFPLRDCPDHKGIYPVIGQVIEGMDEIYRLEKVATKHVDSPYLDVEINEPLEDEEIDHVEVERFGIEYPKPVRMKVQKIPLCWE